MGIQYSDKRNWNFLGGRNCKSSSFSPALKRRKVPFTVPKLSGTDTTLVPGTGTLPTSVGPSLQCPLKENILFLPVPKAPLLKIKAVSTRFYSCVCAVTVDLPVTEP